MIQNGLNGIGKRNLIVLPFVGFNQRCQNLEAIRLSGAGMGIKE
jgi:hypothetical protein